MDIKQASLPPRRFAVKTTFEMNLLFLNALYSINLIQKDNGFIEKNRIIIRTLSAK